MTRHVLAAALLATVATPAHAVPADFRAQADAIIAKAVKEGGPGVSVVITENGKVAYRAQRGYADVASKTAITADTSFRYASITKQFTAAAIMKLVDQGKVSLDDPLTKYLPDYPQPGGSATVRQLLNHTSGIMPYTAIPEWAAKANTGASTTTAGLIEVFSKAPVQFKPGEKYAYNNSGYVLLGAILEKVTGKSWDEAVIALATGPQGLKSIKSGIHEADVSPMAKGHTTDDDEKVVHSRDIHMSNPHAAGALIGTADDLARWGNALHQGKVVSAASYLAMTTPSQTSAGEKLPYGFGLALNDVRGRASIGHNGNIHGFSSGSIYVAEPKIFVAVLSNSDAANEADALAVRLAAAALGDPFPEFSAQPVDMKAVAPLLGRYTLPDGERVFYERGGKLFTRRTGGRELEAIPVGPNRFFYGPTSLTWFDIETGADGKKVMAMHQDGANTAERAQWAGPPPVEKPAFAVGTAVLDSYMGRYTAPIGDFVIARNGDTLIVKLGQQPSFPMKAVSATEFEVMEVGALISFGDVTDGKAETLTLKQNGQTLQAKRAK